MKLHRNPWRGLSVGIALGRTQHNIQSRVGMGSGIRSLPVPPTSIVGPSGDITGASESATEGRKRLAHRITDPHAAEPVGLHPSRLVLGQQGIGHELILVEDGVVEAHPSMVRRGANP